MLPRGQRAELHQDRGAGPLSPHARVRLHEVLAVVWGVLTVATTAAAVAWPEHPLLLAWITFMSGYALMVGHWSAKEGAAPSEEG